MEKDIFEDVISRVLRDPKTFLDVTFGGSKDSVVADNPFIKQWDDSVIESLRRGTATWRDAFIFSSEGGPKEPAIFDAWKDLLVKSRGERFSDGYFTSEEVKSVMNVLDGLTGKGNDVFNGERKDLSFTDLVHEFYSRIRGIRDFKGFHLNEFFPNLKVFVGKGRVIGEKGGENLAYAHGDLSVDVPAKMPFLSKLTGNLTVNAPGVEMSSLKNINGNLTVNENGSLMAPELKGIRGVLHLVGQMLASAIDHVAGMVIDAKVKLPKPLKKLYRRQVSKKIYKELGFHEKKMNEALDSIPFFTGAVKGVRR